MAKIRKQSGRQIAYSPELATEFCERVASGRLMSDVCRDPDMPSHATLYRWMEKHESLRSEYARARISQADEFAAETLRIASQVWEGKRHKHTTFSDGSTEEEVVTEDNERRARLAVDTRKWILSKLFPRQYGDRTEESQPDSGIAEMFKALRESGTGTPEMDESE